MRRTESLSCCQLLLIVVPDTLEGCGGQLSSTVIVPGSTKQVAADSGCFEGNILQSKMVSVVPVIANLP